MTESQTIQSSMVETRKFPPPARFASQAHINSPAEYQRMHRLSIDDPEGYWRETAKSFVWFEPFTRVLKWDPPHAQWFVGGKTNVAYNCLDVQIDRGHGERTAITWEGEPGDGVTLTYRQLRDRVGQCANALKSLGVKKGDIVTLYMPMVPELMIAMLACARIGAPHSIIFGGFSATAIADRVNDAKSRIIVTADGGWRRGSVVPLKQNVDEAVKSCPTVQHVLVLKRCENEIAWTSGRDHWWHELVDSQPAACPPERCDSEDLLFILYTSGTTGKPKGIMHTTGGYMVYTAHSAKYIFDLKPDDVYWCTADIGWVTGHSYITYGPLQNGVNVFMYEGAPNHPDWGRFWDIVQRHRVTIFYTAPTAIRSFMRQGDAIPAKYDMSSLRLLGSVGEPINPEAWMWYHTRIGGERCPIVDTWWQTETGGAMISPLPGCTTLKPGCATKPFFGVDVAVVDQSGKEQPANTGGFLVIRKPWPAMLRGIYGDMERYRNQYWTQVPGFYFTADACRRDEDGNFWLMGRVDDVINISGHRIGTAEVESALVSHPAVAEAAVVGVPHEIKGQALAAFVALKRGQTASDDLKKALLDHVTKEIGAIARPEQIRFSEALPKTRSGKIMRRLLKELASTGEVKGDTTTLEDFGVIASLRESDEG
ncbi:MAG: acetate--CoA ligase [Phycisphaerales bacterium]|nr:acetate--CoA ligase [Phycisphaerales bacterium]